MEDQKLNQIGQEHIPDQTDGRASNATAQVNCEHENEAMAFYQTVRTRLLDVNAWAKNSDLPLSSFKLFDPEGRPCTRMAGERDFIRIDIPGPGTQTGKGYDWVTVEELIEENQNDTEVITLKVRPSRHPLDPDGKIAHFLEAGATSTFQVKRMGTIVQAEEHARNEQANTGTGKLLDNVRNGLVGGAASMGLSYPQWKSLVKGLIKRD